MATDGNREESIACEVGVFQREGKVRERTEGK